MTDGGEPVVFPSPTFPKTTRLERLLGLYDMHEPDTHMQRIVAPSGQISTAQWRRVAELAQRFTPDMPIHVTTRQNMELHGVKTDEVPALHEGLHEAGLTTFRAAGDTPRNVTCCPGSGLCQSGVDILPLAQAVVAAFEKLPWYTDLPRKFKISFSACGKVCGRPWIHDVGLYPAGDGNFKAIVAGSLGARPGTGIPYERTLDLAEVIPFIVAVLKLFNEEGDRENRKKARLRHVRERVGDEAFMADLKQRFETELAEGDWTIPPAPFPPEGMPCQARLYPPLGDMEPEAALRLADAIEAAGAQLRIGIEHDLFIYGRNDIDLPDDLAALAEEPVIVACPGAKQCILGIADSRAVAASIYEGLPKGTQVRICVSGCPNTCAHAAISDIGLLGLKRKVEGESVDHFRLLLGGDMGKGPNLSKQFHPAIPADRIAGVVVNIVETFEAEAAPGADSAGRTFTKFVAEEEERLNSIISAEVG